MAQRIVRKPELLHRLGISATTLKRKIRAGQIPPPVNYGPQLRGWPDDVAEQIFQAALNGEWAEDYGGEAA